MNSSALRPVACAAAALSLLLLAACGGGTGEDAQRGPLAAASVGAGQAAEAVEPSDPGGFLVYTKSRHGLVQAELAAAGARFDDAAYDTVIINVGGQFAESLRPVVSGFLNAGKQVVLDSSGEYAERAVIGQLTGLVAGIAPQVSALSITRHDNGSFTVTPIHTEAFGGGADGQFGANRGNRALAVAGIQGRTN